VSISTSYNLWATSFLALNFLKELHNILLAFQLRYIWFGVLKQPWHSFKVWLCFQRFHSTYVVLYSIYAIFIYDIYKYKYMWILYIIYVLIHDTYICNIRSLIFIYTKLYMLYFIWFYMQKIMHLFYIE